MVLHLVNKEVFEELLSNSSDANFAKPALKLLKDSFILNLEAEDLITKIIALEEVI